MGSGRAARLARIAEGVAWWSVAAPVLSRLPAALAYHVGRWRGDLLYQRQADKREELIRNMSQVLGGSLSPPEAERAAREWFRLDSCEAIDVMRLRGTAGPLRRLAEIRGREHLDVALAAGKGAILCSAHFGSYDSAFSMLGASGFAVTTIGRWQHNYTASLSAAERRFWDFFYARPLRRHRRPNIEPWPGRFQVAAQAAAALRANEVVTICIDVPPLDADLPRAVEVPFLRGTARLVPGVVTLAQLTGAPVLPCFMYRSADYRHQVLEISAPVPVDGPVTAAFERCAATVSAAIGSRPAHWTYWASTRDLATLGLIGPEQVSLPADVLPRPGPALVADDGAGPVVTQA